MTLTNPIETLRFTLTGLGPTYLTAIAVMKAEGITGKMGDPCHCPLGHWVKRRLGGRIVVTEHYFSWDYDGEAYYASLPASFRTFLRIFDAGLLPSLVSANPECGPWQCDFDKRPTLQEIARELGYPICTHMAYSGTPNAICDGCTEAWDGNAK